MKAIYSFLFSHCCYKILLECIPIVGHRPLAHKVAIVMTDGNSYNFDWTIKEANIAIQSGIDVLAIGIGNNIDYMEIIGISTGQKDAKSSSKAFKFPDFASFSAFDTSLITSKITC